MKSFDFATRRTSRLLFKLEAIALLCLCMSQPLARPQTGQLANADTDNIPWSAQWITHPGAFGSDQLFLHFRKILTIDKQPKQFWVDVSADQQFQFFVNRHFVGSGPARGDLQHWRFERYDIAPYLHAGENVLAATVWNFGAETALAQMSEKTAFLLRGEGGAERSADSDATWDVEVEKGIRGLRPELGGYVAEPGEQLDGREFDWLWDSSEFGKGWSKAIPLGRGAPRGETVLSSHRWDAEAPNHWQLMRDPLPVMEKTLLVAEKVVSATGIPEPFEFPSHSFIVPAHTKAAVLLDNSRMTTAYPELTVSGGAGARIRLTYAEALTDPAGHRGNRNEIAGKHIGGLYDVYIADGAAQRTFMPLAWRAWRYLQLDVETGDQPLQIDDLKTWFTAYPFEQLASFAADDPTLDKIWNIGWLTARLDAHDTYLDTPYWERLQYVGDTRIQALISYVVSGDDRLARQAIEALNDSRLPEGLTQSRYPSSLMQIIPPFSLLWVGMVHDFWMYRSDDVFVRTQLQGTRDVLGWFLQKQRSDGLLSKIPWWPFVDWGRDFVWGAPPEDVDGGSSIITLQFIEALRYGAALEDALGDPHLAEAYRAAADRASKAVVKLCWNPQSGLIADTPAQEHFSQHANILAVWLDVVPVGQQKRVMEKVLGASNNQSADGKEPGMTLATYYFRFYLARALVHAGMADEYLQELQQWRQMVDLGLTTWAENPEPSRSDSHAWSAHPTYDLLTIVAGIAPGSPRFKTVRIEPHLGSLRRLSASLAHPDGLIDVRYQREGAGLKTTVDLPPSLTGILSWEGKTYPLHGGRQEFLLQ
jgi:hypothetical protein